MSRLQRILVLLAKAVAVAAAMASSSSQQQLQQQSSSSSFASSDASGSGGVSYRPRTFTPDETRRIVQDMKRRLPKDRDVRIHDSVKRTNYYQDDADGALTSADSRYSWIFERIRPLYDPQMSAQEFQSSVDFVLMHEFETSGFFDWHVDTKPGDGTGRIDNINVMLSAPDEYRGGALTVGTRTVEAQQGDCYWYPASFPHKVDDVTGGVRHTLVVAIKEPKNQKRDGVANEASNDDERQQRIRDRRRREYWERTERNHELLCRALPKESKLHMLHGDFLAAMGRPVREVDAKMADAYASTPEAERYADVFQRQGEQLEQAGNNEEESKGYLNMASMIRSRIAAAAADAECASE